MAGYVTSLTAGVGAKAALVAAALAQTTPIAPPSAASPSVAPSRAATPAVAPDIVVKGIRLEDSRAALERCIARHCPPAEDIAATLAHAENLVLRGDYGDARTVLLASRRRNNRFAAQLPIEVSSLDRANGRVAVLVGQADAGRDGSIEALEALEAGLPETDPRVLSQRLEVGDVFARQGRVDEATGMYDHVARLAHRNGLTVIEGSALFRKAVLLAALASKVAEYRGPARQAADRIAATTDPALASYRDGVVLLKARLDADAGKPQALDAAIARLRAHPEQEPRLLYAPAIDYQQASYAIGATGDDDPQWMDISFYVAPDGTVTDAGILRQSKNFDAAWSKPVLKALDARRYAPLALDPTSPGVLRLERYTLVSDAVMGTGSRIATRSPERHIEVLDLTAPPAQAGAVATGASPG